MSKAILFIILILLPAGFAGCEAVLKQDVDCTKVEEGHFTIASVRTCDYICWPWDAPQPVMCARQEGKTAIVKKQPVTSRGELQMVPLNANTSGLGLFADPIGWAASHATIPAVP